VIRIMSVDVNTVGTDELIANLVAERYKDEIARTTKVDHQSRSLVGSILVVVGFLLAAGTTSIVNVKSLTSLLYFIGVGLLLSSIFTVFVSLRIKKTFIAPNVQVLIEHYNTVDYEGVLKAVASSRADALRNNVEINNKKDRLLMLAWLFLIIGLVVVMSFIILSIVVKPNALVLNL
jgi:uncharacterized membrane protein YidH (DUF202 family)